MRADFSSQDYFRNPTAEIEKLRSAGPIVDVRFPIVGKVWTTTTQDLADLWFLWVAGPWGAVLAAREVRHRLQ